MKLLNEIILEDQRVRLVPLKPIHLEALWQIAAIKELWNFTSTKINSKEDFENYFYSALIDKDAGTALPFVVIDLILDEIIGTTRYCAISLQDKRLEIGYTFYHPKVQATGLNKHVKFLLLKHGFEDLGLNRIELKTALTNKRSRHAIQKIGAKQEGIFRKHIINDDGTIRDTVYFSIINDEWPKIKSTVFEGW